MTDQVETKPDSSDGNPVFRLELPGCSGTGVLLPDGGFLVRAGAVGRAETNESFHKYANKYRQQLRQELLDDGTLLVDGDRAELTRDWEFNSPSAAGAVLTGSNRSWLDKWHDDDGKTLRECLPIETSNSGGGTDPGPASPGEIELRQLWYEAHVGRFTADQGRYQEAMSATEGFRASADEALRLLADLRRTGDLDRFIRDIRKWAVAPGTLDFSGFAGGLLLNQLYDRADEPQRFAHLLAESLTAPASDQEALEKLTSMVDYVKSIKVGAYPAPGSVPFLLSYFWALADWKRWPVMWASAVRFIEFSTGENLPDDPPEKYRVFVERVRELTSDYEEFETTAAWWQNQEPVFLDEVLADRAAFALDTETAAQGDLEINARALVSIAKHWGTRLADDVAEALGHPVKVIVPKASSARPDLWVDWRINEAAENGLSMRVWVTDQGAAVALRPGVNPKGWMDKVAPELSSAKHDGCRVLGGPSSQIGEDVGLLGAHWAEFVYGRWFDREEFADVDLAATVVETATQLKPLFDDLLALADPESQKPNGGDPIASRVEKFRAETGYPRPEDEEHKAEQRRFAEVLDPESIGLADPAEIQRIWNGGNYGGTGPMSGLNRSFRDADAAEYERMAESFRYLCWGEDADEERIDRLLTDDQYRIRGLGESVIMKMLAITHPDKFLCVYPQRGDMGKSKMLSWLELEEPTGSRGEIQVESNRLLRDRLEPFFPDDPWGMSQFFYWYAYGLSPSAPQELDELAEELLVERKFLDDVVELLKDKRQVIFYGPPGTGKTYLARKLAEALAPGPGQRALVQFHPSSSYEDFFEGYRPRVDGGKMTYELTRGPLADMAKLAAGTPDQQHVMIIDEINRANLPKVLGELLFLLEYRDESVRTLYRRPDDPFALPRNLWFIGTMNTADRSIALVDAALRRRFHFIPFFPNREPIAGLLDRWLKANDEPAWVGELVAQVNDELEDALGGDDLLVGPSHFMKVGLDTEAVRRIWEYNIEPFIEDQFFGDPAKIERFRFKSVYERYRDYSGQDELEAAQEQPVTATPSDESDEPQEDQNDEAE